MGSLRAILVVLFSSLMLLRAAAQGSIATIALTGNGAPGVAGGQFAALNAGPLNDSGAIVFTAQLQNGVGGVAAGNDTGVWQYDGSTTLLAREGIANVPGAAGTTFETFHNLAIDPSGTTVLRAALTEGVGGAISGNKEGMWRFNGGVGSLVLRTGSLAVPGVPTGSFGLVPTAIHLGGDGFLAFEANMSVTGGVGDDNKSGVWRYDSMGGTLLGRESITAAPSFGGATFEAFLPPRVNDNREVVLLATLSYVGDINSSNDFCIFKYSDSGGEMIVRKGISAVPGVPSTTFFHFHDAAINSTGQIVFSAALNHSASVDSDSDDGLWLYSGTTGTLLAQSGAGGVPAVPGTSFAEFDPPLINDSAAVLVRARLAAGSGVTAANERGLWKFENGENRLVARAGSGGVPGVGGASYLSFDKVAFNSIGHTAVEATLTQGGAVNATNDRGLWLLGSSGGGRLIAREGGTLAGRTIASLSFVGNTGTSDNQPSGLNDLGQIAFQASFTNGESGLFLYTWRAGDFNGDGDVDGDDLDIWELAMGNNANADADLDGESDGVDFLIWQRQYGFGPLTGDTLTVPEPQSICLLAIIGWNPIVLRRVHRRRMLNV